MHHGKEERRAAGRPWTCILPVTLVNPKTICFCASGRNGVTRVLFLLSIGNEDIDRTNKNREYSQLPSGWQRTHQWLLILRQEKINPSRVDCIQNLHWNLGNTQGLDRKGTHRAWTERGHAGPGQNGDTQGLAERRRYPTLLPRDHEHHRLQEHQPSRTPADRPGREPTDRLGRALTDRTPPDTWCWSWMKPRPRQPDTPPHTRVITLFQIMSHKLLV